MIIFVRPCKKCGKAFDYGEKDICNECRYKKEVIKDGMGGGNRRSKE